MADAILNIRPRDDALRDAASLERRGVRSLVMPLLGIAHLDGSCHTPIAASAVCGDDGQLHLDAMILRPDGGAAHRRQHNGPIEKAAMLGEELGAALLDDAGGREFLA